MSQRDPITGLYAPSKTFKLPKVFKRIGASIGANKTLRDHWKHMGIQAVLQSEDKPAKEKKNGRQPQE